MRKGICLAYVALCLAALVLFSFASAARAAEVQLAGVRLDEPVVNLLTRPGWGQPQGIGPLAELAAALPGGTGGRTAATGTVAAVGPAGTRVGALAGRAASATTPGMLPGMMPGMPGMMPGMMGAMGPGIAGMRPGMTGRMGTTGQPGAVSAGAWGLMNQPTQRTEKGELRGTRGLQYWLYPKRGGVRVILGVEPSGNIATITVQGSFSPEVYTSRGIGLGDSFTDLISAYGYPERTQPTGEGLEITYPEQDVRFALKSLRITEITIGQPPAPPPAAVQAAMPGALGRQQAVPRAGTPGARLPAFRPGMMMPGMMPGMMRRGMMGTTGQSR